MIVEDAVENDDTTAMSIEETAAGDVDELLGTGAVSMPEVSTTASLTPCYKDISKSKGISKSTIANEINFDNYQSALDTLHPQRHTVRRIKSDKHALYLEQTHKSSIVVSDSKRFWLNKYQSLAFGNKLARNATSASGSAEEEELDAE